MFGGDKAAASRMIGMCGSLGPILSLLTIPLVQYISRRCGKHITIRIALGWIMVGAALKWVCYTPTYPYLQMVIPFFYSPWGLQRITPSRPP